MKYKRKYNIRILLIKVIINYCIRINGFNLYGACNNRQSELLFSFTDDSLKIIDPKVLPSYIARKIKCYNDSHFIKSERSTGSYRRKSRTVKHILKHSLKVASC